MKIVALVSGSFSPQNKCASVVFGGARTVFSSHTLVFYLLLLLLVKATGHRDWFVRALLSANELANKWNQDKRIDARWVSVFEKKFDIQLRKSLDRKSNIQHPTSIFVSKQGEVFLFSHHSFVFPSNPISMHAQIVVIVCTSCLCLFVLYFVIANVICAQKFWSIKHTNTVSFFILPWQRQEFEHLCAREAKKKSRSANGRMNNWNQEETTRGRKVRLSASERDRWIWTRKIKRKREENKNKDGMFYWEGARQIIERKFYF